MATVNAPPAIYQKPEQFRALEERIREAVNRLPQAANAAVTDTVPFSGFYNDSVILAEGHIMQAGESVISPWRVAISPGYFETMEIGLVSGRRFTEDDSERAPNAVIVDERLARKFWPGTDPIGKRLYFPRDEKDLMATNEKTTWLRVVGVARDVRIEDLAGSLNTVGTYYLPSRRILPEGFRSPSATTEIPALSHRECARHWRKLTRNLPSPTQGP